jgi:hypothetical protein
MSMMRRGLAAGAACMNAASRSTLAAASPTEAIAPVKKRRRSRSIMNHLRERDEPD